MVAKKKVELPRTLLDVISEGERELRELVDQKHAYVTMIKEQVHQHFVANGGCDKCGGRGWIVTWDTLDSMSGAYAEYGACPNPECNDMTRQKSGRDASYSKYDRARGVADPCGATNTAYKLLVEPMEKLMNELHMKLDILRRENKQPVVGTRVVVVKGRKVPVGTIGRVAFISNNGGILIKDESVWKDRKANGSWVDPGNVGVIVDSATSLTGVVG